MKSTTKRTTLAVAGVLAIGALAATVGTISYFTDTDTTTNTFTIGNVDITLYESQLHRENSGRMGNFPALASDPDYCDWTVSSQVTTTAGNATLIDGSYDNARYCTPNLDVEVGDADTISAVANGHTASNRSWGFTDELIMEDAATYKATLANDGEDGYFTRVSQNIVPGQWIRKFAYVVNESTSSDAYILIRYMVPTEYDGLIDLKVPGTPYDDGSSHFAYFTAIKKDANDEYVVATPGETYTETIGEGANAKTYTVYAAVTNEALKPGEMTFWSPVNTVRLNPNASTDDFDYTNGNPIVDIIVDAQGIQAKTFSSAIEAINNL